MQAQSSINETWREESIGKLGNLIFIDQRMNERLGTKVFPEKISLLKSEGYSLPEFMKDKSAWTPDDVDEHTNILADDAYNEIWKI